jgi:uncharacterized membrane protein
MTTLTAYRFDNAESAEHATKTLRDLTDHGLVTIDDAASVRWETGASRPTTQQLHSLVGVGAFGDMFWGMLFGVLFYLPLIGAAAGTANRGVSQSLAYVGIDDGFVNRARDEIHPGTSALFLMSPDGASKLVENRFTGLHGPEVLLSRLAPEHEAALHEVFSD